MAEEEEGSGSIAPHEHLPPGAVDAGLGDGHEIIATHYHRRHRKAPDVHLFREKCNRSENFRKIFERFLFSRILYDRICVTLRLRILCSLIAFLHLFVDSGCGIPSSS